MKQKKKARRTANLLTQDFTSACIYVPLCCSSETHVATPLLPAGKEAKTNEQSNKKYDSYFSSNFTTTSYQRP